MCSRIEQFYKPGLGEGGDVAEDLRKREPGWYGVWETKGIKLRNVLNARDRLKKRKEKKIWQLGGGQ